MAPKRKAKSVSQAGKRAKGVSIPSVSDVDALAEPIISQKNYNNIVKLLDHFDQVVTILEKNDDEEVEKSGRKIAVSLFNVFEKLMAESLLISRKSYDEKKTLVVKWLVEKYERYKNLGFQLVSGTFSARLSIQVDLLEILMNLVRLESQYFKSAPSDPYFASRTYTRAVTSLISRDCVPLGDGTSDDFLVFEFKSLFGPNWDLQFYFFNQLDEELKTLKKTFSPEKLQLVFANVYTILKDPLVVAEVLEDAPLWTNGPLPNGAYKRSSFKSQFQKAILTLLTFPLTQNQYKSVLLILHNRIIPHMAQPQRLMDFLTDSYNSGGEIVPILALNSLYELMKTFNLEYPDFYTKLYSLLTPRMMYTRYRSRYFRLCDLFLSSTHLSAALIASFIKRLARLALTSSASGVVIVIPFIYNLLKRHPTCMIMVHNPNVTNYTDPFDNDEQDPLKTKAIGSSVWELETLMTHYHPNVATLATIFKEPFRKHNYNLEDFLDWSYASLLESEKNRKYRPAALEFERWPKVFGLESYTGWSL